MAARTCTDCGEPLMPLGEIVEKMYQLYLVAEKLPPTEACPILSEGMWLLAGELSGRHSRCTLALMAKERLIGPSAGQA